MNLVKIKTITDGPQSKSLKDIQSLLGFANFYQKFIYAYSNFVVPLINLTKKSVS